MKTTTVYALGAKDLLGKPLYSSKSRRKERMRKRKEKILKNEKKSFFGTLFVRVA